MKKHSKIFKAVTVVIALITLFSGMCFYSEAAYSSYTSTYSCSKLTCSNKLIVVGPLCSTDTIPSSVPYIGGQKVNACTVIKNKYNDTIAALQKDWDDVLYEEHIIIAYCSDYKESNLVDHTFVVFFLGHGTSDYIYSPYNDTSHSIRKVCTDTTFGDLDKVINLGKSLSSTNETNLKNEVRQWAGGCGSYTYYSTGSHSLSYSSWSSTGSSQHSRTATCSKCGYSRTETVSHSLTYGSWTSNGSTQHKRTVSCSACNYSTTETANHSLSYGSWSKTATQHSRTVTCSTCGYSTTEVASHTWRISNYSSTGSTQHTYTKTCTVCGYSESVTENHSLSYGNWYQYSLTEQKNIDPSAPDNLANHARNVTCSKCGYSGYEYASHNLTIRTPSDSSRYINPEVGEYLYGDYHYYTLTCPTCGYSGAYYYKHTYGNSSYSYKNADVHLVSKPCTSCDYVKEYDETHNYSNSYSPYSETQHKLTRTCVCGNVLTSYSNHADSNGDNLCDDCGYVMVHFSVTVPTTMNIAVDRNGTARTATNATITNNSTGAVKVKGINLTAKNGWTIVPFSTNMANQKVDSKKIGLKICNSVSSSSSAMTMSGNWTIAKNGTLTMPYNAVVSATTTPISEQNVLDITFVIDWGDA